jgi:hypothetical protein
MPEALGDWRETPPTADGARQAMSANNKTRFHLRDGPEQIARDAEMAKA